MFLVKSFKVLAFSIYIPLPSNKSDTWSDFYMAFSQPLEGFELCFLSTLYELEDEKSETIEISKENLMLIPMNFI